MGEKDSEIGDASKDTNEVYKIKDIGQMSQYELFHYYKVMGSLNPGPRGLEFLRSAKGTGEAILMTLENEQGHKIFGNDKTQDGHERIQNEEGKYEVLNIAYYVTKILTAKGVYEDITAMFQGVKGKRTISMNGFNTEQMGSDSVEDIRMAEERAWSIASGKMNDALGWLESQMTTYGLIKNALVPISIVGKSDKWDKSISSDEYWRKRMETELEAEKAKVRKTLNAEKPGAKP